MATENATMTEVDTASPQSGYRSAEGFFDELFDADGLPRPHAAALAAALHALGPERLAAAGRRRDAIFLQQGITFDTTGETGRRSSDRSRWTSYRGSCRRRSGRTSSAAWRSASAH